VFDRFLYYTHVIYDTQRDGLNDFTMKINFNLQRVIVIQLYLTDNISRISVLGK
jgi:hypothetical protein